MNLPESDEKVKLSTPKEVRRFEGRRLSESNEYTVYDRLTKYWRHFAVTGIILAAYFSYLRWQSEIFPSGTFFDVFIMTFFSSIIVASIVVLAERIFEKGRTTDYLARELDVFEERLTSRMENLVSARYKYGLKQMRKIDDGEIIANSNNTNIMWLNTKFSDSLGAKESIDAALQNGASVRLLLMHKDNPCGGMRGRESCPYPDDAQALERSGSAYIEELSSSQQDLASFYLSMLRLKKEDAKRGDFEVRFYRDMPAVPMLIVESGPRHEDVYTGFYLNKYSSGMPYIQWGSADENFIENIYRYFETKWHFAEGVEEEAVH